MLSEFYKSYKNVIYNIVLILLFIILALCSSFLLWHSRYIFGAADIQFHLRRLIELEISLKHGNIFPSFSFNMFNGSAVMSLYPYINLLPIAILYLFIKSNFVLVYVFFSLNVFISLIIGYYCSFSFNNSRQVSLIFSIIYSLSIPFLTYGFYNMDMGVVTSIAVFPLIFFGSLELINNNKWIQLSLGLILLIFSHILSVFIAISLLVIFLLINLKKINKQLLYNLSKMVVFVVLITSIVCIPILNIVSYNVTNLKNPSLFRLNGTSFISLFQNGFEGHITYDLSFVAILGAIVPIIFYKWLYKRFNYNLKQIFWIAWIYIIICSNIFPWDLTNHGPFIIFKIFQFTWRLYIIPELLLSYVISICITKCINYKYECVKYGLMSILILIVIMFQITGQRHFVSNNINSPILTKRYVMIHTHNHKCYFSDFISPGNNKMTGTNYFKIYNRNQFHRLLSINIASSSPDYYPRSSLSKLNYINNNKAIYDRNQTINVKHTGYNQFSFSSPKKINRLTLPLLHYSGEHLRVYVNNHLAHYHTNGNNLIMLSSVKKGKHQIKIKYIPNVWLVILKTMMFFGGILWLLLICYKKIMGRNILKNHEIKK